MTAQGRSVCVVVTNDDGLAEAARALGDDDRCVVVRCRYVGLSDAVHRFATHAVVDERHIGASDVRAVVGPMPIVASTCFEGVLDLVKQVVQDAAVA